MTPTRRLAPPAGGCQGKSATSQTSPGCGTLRSPRSGPRQDMLSARFSDAEFAANLALVDQGVGSEEYVDPATFFRITYATEGLTRVPTWTLARLAGRGAIRSSDSRPTSAAARRTPCRRSAIWRAPPRPVTGPKMQRTGRLAFAADASELPMPGRASRAERFPASWHGPDPESWIPVGRGDLANPGP